MAELFAANQLGVVLENRWTEWADGIAGIGRFPGVPDSRNFATWQDWASAFNNALRK